MKGILITVIVLLGSFIPTYADERPITSEQLPAAARSFLYMYYSNDAVSYAVKDDYLNPEYKVRLESGVELEFNAAGKMRKVEYYKGVLPELIPARIRAYVSEEYPKAIVTSLEKERNKYEIELDNGLDLTFDKHCRIIEIDD